jgi:hypothetical protein
MPIMGIFISLKLDKKVKLVIKIQKPIFKPAYLILLLGFTNGKK